MVLFSIKFGSGLWSNSLNLSKVVLPDLNLTFFVVILDLIFIKLVNTPSFSKLSFINLY